MHTSKHITRSFRIKLMATVAVSTIMAVPAIAQEGQQAKPVEKVTVTGSRVKQKNLQTSSPVTQLGATTIDSTGNTRVEDLINDLPQVFIGQNSAISNGSNGTATVNLRGLGSDRTLVLINGRRLAAGNPNGSSAADLNQIPAQLVDRIEVLTGGASAVYGSDALAGVVNFIMKSDFEGVSIDANYGFYQHKNGYDGPGNLRNVIATRGLTNPAQFQLPPDEVNDGWSKEVSIMAGASTGDGKGNVTGYFSYRNNDAVLQSQRDFSACALNNAPLVGSDWTCGGSGTAASGQFTDFATFSYTIDQTTGLARDFSSATDQYNFGPINYFQRPDERYSGGVFANYVVDEQVELYGELMFSDYKSVAQIAPSGVFFNTSTINCGNPFLSAGAFTPAQLSSFGCTPAAIAANTSVPFYVGRRNVEGGGRQDTFAFNSARFVVGARGEVVSGWDYDVSMQFQRVGLRNVYLNDFSVSRIGRALNAVNVAGTPTCQSVVDGTDPNCVPYNPFQVGGVTQAQLDYLSIPLVRVGSSEQSVATGTLSGDLGTLGLLSPWARTTPSLVLGAEFRRDATEEVTDISFSTGDGAGQGGPRIGTPGSVDVQDLFLEVDLPIVEDALFIKSFKLDGAYRRSSYDTGISTDTNKLGFEWAPLESFKFRGSSQRAVRAANISELFAAQSVGLFGGTDPCDRTQPGYAGDAACIGANPWQVTLAQANSGALTSPAGQYNFLGGGNPLLTPERSDTKTLGVVLTPSFLSNFVASIDYFNIEVDNAIGSVPAGQALSLCYTTVPSLCSQIQRNPANGSLWVGSGQVAATNINIGGIATSGVDLNVNYRFDLADIGFDGAGDVKFDMVGTWLDTLMSNNGVSPAYDCAGLYAPASWCGTANPEWRHRLSATWLTPWDASLTAVWRHVGSVDRVDNCTSGVCSLVVGRLDSVLDSYDYLDLSASVALPLNMQFRLGIDNVFDKDPPIVGSNGSSSAGSQISNGNVLDGNYDQLGRRVFLGIAVDL